MLIKALMVVFTITVANAADISNLKNTVIGLKTVTSKYVVTGQYIPKVNDFVIIG
jgi:exosome complex RNA-binding protein Rrp4